MARSGAQGKASGGNFCMQDRICSCCKIAQLCWLQGVLFLLKGVYVNGTVLLFCLTEMQMACFALNFKEFKKP